MLTITVPGVESFDDVKQEFITSDEVVLDLEHSLVSLSKWEEIWEKPFLGPTEKTREETISYVQCMVLTPGVPPEVFLRLSSENYDEINAYINKKMTATWFREVPGKKPSREVITAELIYYWMMTMNVPFERETWHLNRLFTLLKVTSEKNSPPKKMSRSEMLAQRERLNAERRAQSQSSG